LRPIRKYFLPMIKTIKSICYLLLWYMYKLCGYNYKFLKIIPSMLYTRYDLSHDGGLEHPP